jgi:drug/metabolite transporter (DMT)-like permease
MTQRSMQQTHIPSTKDWLTMFGLAFVWGFSFLFIKRSVAIFTPIQMLSWRMVMAFLAYVPVAIAYWSRIRWQKWYFYLLVALCGSAIPNLIYGFAQQHVSSSLAGILNALTPLFTLVTGYLIFKMQVTRNKVAGILMGLVGAIVLVVFNAKSGVSGQFLYAAMCAFATVFYALNSNIIGTKLQGHHPAAIASASFMLLGPFAIGMLVGSGGIEAAYTHPRGWEGVGYLAFLGIVGTALASIIYFDLLQKTNTLFATSVTFLLPVMSMLIGAWDGEPVGISDVLATGIILGGLYLARK